MKTVALAGTFDRLHKGHEKLLTYAFSIDNKVIIGLTSDAYLNGISNIKYQIPASPKRKRGESNGQIKIQNYEERKNFLTEFLKEKKYYDRAEIIELNNIYGPAIEKNDIEALVVTRETLPGARLVNKKRSELKLLPLKLHIVPFVIAEDGKRISSTRIRMGVIDRNGKKYQVSGGKISEKLRLALKKPQGVFIKGDEEDYSKVNPALKKIITDVKPVMIATVGDEVTKLANAIKLPINLAIFDFLVRRRKKYHSLEHIGLQPNHITTVRNPAGFISNSLVVSIQESYKNYFLTGKQQSIKIIGEDDLAGVPVILLAPLGSIVIYGQPKEGIVVVTITEKKKYDMQCLIDKS